MKKPFILAFILFIIWLILKSIYKEIFNIFPILYSPSLNLFPAINISWFDIFYEILIGMCFGIVYSVINKIEISKRDKMKTFLYFILILSSLIFITILILRIPNDQIFIPVISTLIGALFLYMGIPLGCKCALYASNKIKLIRNKRF